MPLPIDADTRSSVERQISELDGVIFASLDLEAGLLWVIRDPYREPAPLELAVRDHLASLDETRDITIRVALPADAEPRRRVRFLDASRSETQLGATVTVSIEWNGVVHTGSATGERGAAVELKTTGQAALNALESLTDQSLDTRIIGIKVVHAFDSDVMVASMIRDGSPPQRLVGAIIVGNNPVDSAALAVLSGINRTLGNFLHTSD
jgi:hypothetical protein